VASAGGKGAGRDANEEETAMADLVACCSCFPLECRTREEEFNGVELCWAHAVVREADRPLTPTSTRDVLRKSASNKASSQFSASSFPCGSIRAEIHSSGALKEIHIKETYIVETTLLRSTRAILSVTCMTTATQSYSTPLVE
jgi:hypothetical protein